MYQMQEDFQRNCAPHTQFQPLSRPIAIVDDNIDDQLFLKREVRFIFGSAPILTFQNGADLIRHLRLLGECEAKPWLILLDLDMPQINGFKTLEILRKDTSTSDIPVVVVSGTLKQQDVHDSFEHGAKAFLPKPVSRQAFAALLHHGAIFKAAIQEGSIVKHFTPG